MVRWVVVGVRIVCALVALSACLGRAFAQELERDPLVEATCRREHAVARSNHAYLASPQVFANAMSFQQAGGAAGLDIDVTGQAGSGFYARVQVGAIYSPTAFARGRLGLSLSKALCEELRAESRVRALRPRGRIDEAEAYRAAIAVLEEALPEAQEKTALAARALSASAITLQEYEASSTRLQALQEKLHETRLHLVDAEAIWEATELELARERERLVSAARQRARAEGRLRTARAFDLDVRAGYDRIFGLSQRAPVLLAARFTFAPGWFASRAWEREAEVAEAEVVRELLSRDEDRGPGQDARVARELALERARLVDQELLERDLAQRLDELASAPGAEAERVRDVLWYQCVLLRADLAYRRERVRLLAAWLGERHAS